MATVENQSSESTRKSGASPSADSLGMNFTLTTAIVPKDWHASVDARLRRQHVVSLMDILLTRYKPLDVMLTKPNQLDKQIVKSLRYTACSMEGNVYNMADSADEYTYLVNDHIVILREEMERVSMEASVVSGNSGTAPQGSARQGHNPRAPVGLARPQLVRPLLTENVRALLLSMEKLRMDTGYHS
ncbi:uncharacterized protein LOC143298570 [Babylonia areolata]|uniref:uncharacterized protein LOC143298570 n=1 Tax=Babylonia areolata TaxID=304850 RepID=UPI003FCFAB70